MTIAFLGDSITLGYGLENKDVRYATLVSEALEMTELNYGITGTLMAKAGLDRSNDKDFLSRAHLLDDADVAVVFGGTNDYFWSDAPIYGEGAQYFASAVRTLIERVREKRNGRVTLFVTPYPHNGVGNFPSGSYWKDSNRHDTDEKNFNGHTLREYVDVIEELCRKENIPCLNLHENFEFDWRSHTIDGCHPNKAGHALIADAIVNKLKTLLS